MNTSADARARVRQGGSEATLYDDAVGVSQMHWEPEDVLVDGDKAVARVRFTATNDGEFMGMPATGRNVSIQVIDIIRFGEDGLAREHWGVLDMMGLMQQLGLALAPRHKG